MDLEHGLSDDVGLPPSDAAQVVEPEAATCAAAEEIVHMLQVSLTIVAP